VLRPHDGEHSKLGGVRLAPEELDDAIVFGVADAGRRDLPARLPAGLSRAPAPRLTSAPTVFIAPTLDSKISRPSTPPTSGSHARSGCGIMPTTFLASLQMPAIALTEPFGFHRSSSVPAGSV
jgi:hypothetical protein